MKNLRLMALIVGVTLMLFAVNFALAKSEKNAAKEPPAASSPDKIFFPQSSKDGGEGFIREIAKALFTEQDSNKDGKVSHDEFIAPHEKHFKEVDANKDGFWTMEEFVDSQKKAMSDTKAGGIFQ